MVYSVKYITNIKLSDVAPMELAIPTLKLNGENKWLELIDLSKINNQ